MTIEQIKIIGTKIPYSDKLVKYRLYNWTGIYWSKTNLLSRDFIVYGVTKILNEECVLIDIPNYDGPHYYIVPISELIRTGIVEAEFVLNEKWCIKITEENKNVLAEFYAKNSYKNYLDLIPNKYFGYYALSHNLYSNDSIFSENPGSNFMTLEKFNFKEITFEQFLKYVLKQETMNITGYKVLKLVPFTTYQIGDIIVKNNDCKNYPEFFEPIYEEEFKVDDWVIDEEFGIGKIKEIIYKQIRLYDKLSKSKDTYNFYLESTVGKRIRKATPEEIKDFETVEINDYKAEYSNIGNIKFGCKEFSKQQILTYLYLLEIHIDAKITIGSTEITTEILNKILTKLN